MKMWDGRFKKPTDRLMEAFNNSLSFDKALIEEDIEGSIAWAHALTGAGILTGKESLQIVKGLRSLAAEYKKGTLVFDAADEDIHMALERLLTERIGEAGAKLHTGRSRNDQVATDVRLHIRKTLPEIHALLTRLQQALIVRAEQDLPVVIPAYTHLQQAQPILLAHYWLSFFYVIEREKTRLSHAQSAAGACPLGSGAVAGSGFAIDRRKIAEELGFAKATENSLDGVASRDYLLETLAAVASIGISLSRQAEDLIIWSSREFSFIELDDAWSSGSSMMPQKKNPDSLELIRGKSGRFIGNYMRCAATVKGVGLAYYKDLQEDKEPLFDSLTQIRMVIEVFTQVLATLTVNAGSIGNKLDPLLLATDLADYLVNRGLPFRQAHKVVGAMVAHCIEKKTSFAELTLTAFKAFSPLFREDVKKCLSWTEAIRHRTIAGGTGEKSVANQLREARNILDKDCESAPGNVRAREKR
jgi:argininosuccinate lyase